MAMRAHLDFGRASRFLLAGAGFWLGGCQGVVNPEGEAPSAPPGAGTATPGAPRPGGTAASGGAEAATPSTLGAAPGNSAGAGPGPGSSAGGASSAPSSPPGVLGAVAEPFARLTRAEYRATIASAFGIDPDPSLIPVDGRVGPFTSNADQGSDPVHPYLLLAEDLALALVPAELPECSGGDVGCLRDAYGDGLERLFRRPVTDTELDRFATSIGDLMGQGVSAIDATRAILSAALVSPDFVFRAAAAGGSAARSRRLAERISYALWDAPPDAALLDALEGPVADLGARLGVEAKRLARDPRAVSAVARFVAQWLHVDTDSRLEDPAFEGSPRFRELLAFVEDALESAVPVRDFVAGERGFVHRDNRAAYGLDAAIGSGEIAAVTWGADSPRRGVISEELFADATRHPDKSRRVIFRGRLVRSSLLCDVIPAPAPELVAAASEVSDRTTDARCSSCHLLMDPIGKAFAAFDVDDPTGGGPAEIRSHAELEGSYPDLPSLFDAVATSRAFAECFAENWLSFFLEQPLASADPVWIDAIADAVQAGASLPDVVESTARTLEVGSAAVAPMCEGGS